MSLDTISTSEAVLLFYIYPSVMMLSAYFILMENLSFQKILSIFIGFFGIYFIITKGNLLNFSLTNIYGDLFALIGGSAFGIYSVLIKKRNYDYLIALFFVFLFGLIYSLPIVFIFSSFAISIQYNFIPIIFLGIFSFCLAHIAWFVALKNGETHLLASAVYLIPALSIVAIHIILKETISGYLLVGLLIILLGIFIQKTKLVS